MPNRDVKWLNLIKAIVDDADKKREKVIAINSKTFEDVYGKEIHLKLSTVAIESLKRDLEELDGKTLS